jgi:hypothetical protein
VKTHGAQATDPVANESDCCFGCDYHNCLVTTCDHCEEIIGWDWEADNWSHLNPPAGHRAEAEPPEHLAWLKQQRLLLIDGDRL